MFILGGVSILIVSPCTTAPLAGVLTYISSTGDVRLGAMALFALGLGMGIVRLREILDLVELSRHLVDLMTTFFVRNMCLGS